MTQIGPPSGLGTSVVGGKGFLGTGAGIGGSCEALESLW